MPTQTGIPNFLTAWDEINALIQGRQREANAARIPGAEAAEQASTAGIMEMLNPGYDFPEVNRRSAELGAMRGVVGSAASATGGYRMTDEERLKRMALGQQWLSGAYERNPIANIDAGDVIQTYITPAQREDFAQQREDRRRRRDQFNLERAVQGSLGRSTDARGNLTPQRVNIAGTGWAPQWVDWLPGQIPNF
jgi:hypothetical protein